jgi:8-amino-7-oxononanoate synthase
VIDFTSALYLGMRHASGQLPSWGQLTMGVPAALAEPPGTRRLMQAIARLQGCERATFATSTLHLFWDLFALLAREAVAIYMDDGLYPIARWGIERAAARCVPVHSFPHHDADALHNLLKQTARARVKPLVVTDGFSPGSGKPAPLVSYLESARSFGGYLIMDDTQALGIFGHTPDAGAPYGHGGGGMLRAVGISDPNVLIASSLAKGFGVPVAVLSGSNKTVEYFKERSDTRVHCSPPSIVHLQAVEHALAVNEREGETLRSRLSQLVCYFRRRLAAIGFSLIDGLFPVQTLINTARLDLIRLHERLLQLGIKTVLHSNRSREEARLSFIITALHTPGQIDAAVSALVQATTFQTRWRAATTQSHPIY